jgi:hypothetical protein
VHILVLGTKPFAEELPVELHDLLVAAGLDEVLFVVPDVVGGALRPLQGISALLVVKISCRVS